MKLTNIFYIVAPLLSVFLVTSASDDQFMSTADIIKMGISLILIIALLIVVVLAIRKRNRREE
jgi:C4-dicarboxylate transporter